MRIYRKLKFQAMNLFIQVLRFTIHGGENSDGRAYVNYWLGNSKGFLVTGHQYNVYANSKNS